jgi:hypothetical protein
MMDPDDNAEIFEPDDRKELAALEARLEDERPLPRPAFRGELRRQLLAQEAAPLSARHLRLLIAAYAICGSVLLAVAALGTAGAGPLAAS